MFAERLTERTEARRVGTSDSLDAKHRSRWGQFFTPAPVAAVLADLIELPNVGPFRVLDPGAGVGSLSAALVARLVREQAGCSLHLVAVESDPDLIGPLEDTLVDCQAVAEKGGVELSFEIRPCDFLLWAADILSGTFWATSETFDACVMNPPYRKLNVGSEYRIVLERCGLRVTNLYTAFMGSAAALLAEGGQLSSITPRSFANGPYFLPFRDFFLDRMGIDFLHVYEKRGRVFADTNVLQENVILHATRGRTHSFITLSTSTGLDDSPVTRKVPVEEVVRVDDQRFIHIPLDEEATRVASRIAQLPATLDGLGVQVSTGRVVDFRTRENLRADPVLGAAPLIYPGHLRDGSVKWPLLDGRKANALAINEDTTALLLPNGDYSLVKRFSAKEERRRVTAAWFRPAAIPTDVVAFENHLNVFHRAGRGIEPALAAGLTVFLNTTVVDGYVRQFSGHTQINTTDLRLLRYPSRSDLLVVGGRVVRDGFPVDQPGVDRLADSGLFGARDGEFVSFAA